MRTSVVVAIVLLAAVVLAGLWTEGEMLRVSDRYAAFAAELKALTVQQEWAAAAELANDCLREWEAREPRLQMLINHEDTDNVTLSLVLLRAAIEAEDVPGCLEACAQLLENARHLHHRDAFTLANVL